MAGQLVSISLIGDKDLVRMFKKIPAASNRKVIASALRKSEKRFHVAVMQKISSGFFGPSSKGKLTAAMRKAKVRAGKRTRTSVSYFLEMPTRDELGIAASAKGFYPFAVEYGVTKGRAPTPAHSYLRSTVDERAPAERAIIIGQIGSGIVKEAARLAGKAKNLR